MYVLLIPYSKLIQSPLVFLNIVLVTVPISPLTMYYF
jgi:hypothetical protein